MLKNLTTFTEILMLLYWVLSLLMLIGTIQIDPQWIYSDYKNPLIVAWNWSFFPLDMLFITLGLVSRFAHLSFETKRVMKTVEASLMFCAGLLAISFWVFNHDFDLLWWFANFWFMGLGLVNLFQLARSPQ